MKNILCGYGVEWVLRYPHQRQYPLIFTDNYSYLLCGFLSYPLWVSPEYGFNCPFYIKRTKITKKRDI